MVRSSPSALLLGAHAPTRHPSRGGSAERNPPHPTVPSPRLQPSSARALGAGTRTSSPLHRADSEGLGCPESSPDCGFLLGQPSTETGHGSVSYFLVVTCDVGRRGDRAVSRGRTSAYSRKTETHRDGRRRPKTTTCGGRSPGWPLLVAVTANPQALMEKLLAWRTAAAH